MAKVKLFCLPYAGGSAAVYHLWKPLLAENIELYPVELAGRGKRVNIPFYSNMDEALNDICYLLRWELEKPPYAFFGHSMGNLLLYELSYKLKELQRENPVHLFFSGRRPPHIKNDDTFIHNIPDREFKKEIVRLGGIPQEILDRPELFDFFIPILKADYQLLGAYEYKARDDKLDCDITVLAGKNDYDNKLSDMYQWKQHAKHQCSIHEFEGGHFFIHDQAQMKKIVTIINHTLNPTC